MASRFEHQVLVLALAAWASGAAAQDDYCTAKINNIQKIGDIQAALNCVEGHVTAEANRSRQQAENEKKDLLQQIDKLEVVTTKVRHMSLKEATNGTWKQIPDSEHAFACFLSSVRLPPQGLCQVTYEGPADRWSYNVSDIAGAGFVCTATCIWTGVQRKPENAEAPARQ